MINKILVQLGGSLEIDVAVDGCSLPFIEMVYRVGRQRNWIILTKSQTEELIIELQRRLPELTE